MGFSPRPPAYSTLMNMAQKEMATIFAGTEAVSDGLTRVQQVINAAIAQGS